MDDRATSRRHIFGEKFATEILVAELQESMFLLHTTTVITGQGFFYLRLSVCLRVCPSVVPHDISKTASARIIELDEEMFYGKS